MKRTTTKTTKQPTKNTSDARFAHIADAFATDRHVTRGERKGFGSGALKVNGKIFAMVSSRDQFVVKLPAKRVDELIAAGEAERFDPGHGKLMKEWAVIIGKTDWLALAKEAHDFVKRGKL